MWISFKCTDRHSRFVVRPFVGGINAISGAPLTGDMTSVLKSLNSVSSGQDYLVLPKQPWLDGIATSPGVVKQFVAAPMLSAEQQELRTSKRREQQIRQRMNPSVVHDDFELGASIELQLTGRDSTAGFQLAIVPEHDKENMWVVIVPNMAPRGLFAMGPDGEINRDVSCLNVLRTPAELGFQSGQMLHFKDPTAIGDPRPKVVGDLLDELPQGLKKQEIVTVHAVSSTERRGIFIECPDRPKSSSLNVWVSEHWSIHHRYEY
jgi:hypothetical protein